MVSVSNLVPRRGASITPRGAAFSWRCPSTGPRCPRRGTLEALLQSPRLYCRRCSGPPGYCGLSRSSSCLPAARPARSPARSAVPGVAVLGSTFKKHVEEAGIVGASLLVVRDGQVLTHETVGYQDRDTRTPTAPTTIYHWASITKTFTGIAIMQLRDRGLLTLDDAGRQLRARAAARAQPVRRHLAGHDPPPDAAQRPASARRRGRGAATSRGTRSSRRRGSSSSRCCPTRSCCSRREPSTATRTPASSSWGGSSSCCPARTTRSTSTKNILMPLGMHRTFFDRAPYHLLPHRSHSYSRTDGALAEAPLRLRHAASPSRTAA